MSSPQHPHASVTKLQTGAQMALIGFAINVFLAGAKIFAGLFGHAHVLIADGIESALDVGGSIVIWAGLTVAARPPDATHPYGHGKAEPIAAVAVSVGVLAAAIVVAVQSVRGLFLPHQAPAPYTLGVLIVAVIVKEILYRYVIRFGRKVESTAVKTDAWHHRIDAMTSVTAFIGISVALIGGKKWQSADEWAALFACALIGANGYSLLRPAVFEIMDTAPGGKTVRSIRRVAGSVAGVIRVEQCRVRKMGLQFYVDLHIEVDGRMSVHEGHEISHEVKRAIQQNDSRMADVLVHIEPAHYTRDR
jgi:cation diffusion facilitator family transporter